MHHPPQRGLFYGWIVVTAALSIIAIGVGLMFSLSVFMEPLEQAFGWSREQIARANLYGWVVFGVCSFAFGTLSDRFGTRWIVLCGGLLFGCGLLALSRMQTLWQLYLFHGGLIGGSIGTFMVPLTATVTRWFTHRRGLAVALVNCGTGLGGMLFAPLTRYLLTASDWRTAFVVYGLLAWVVVIPLALLIRNSPHEVGLEPYQGKPLALSEAGSTLMMPYTFRQVLATPAFWIIAGVHTLCCAAHSGPIFHMISAIIDQGLDKLAAATVFSLASLASIFGRIGTGFLADRFGSKQVLATWMGMQATAILLYLAVSDVAGFAMLALFFGVSYGGIMPLYAVVAREFFGARAMGTSYGAIFLLSCFGMGFGGWLGGRIFDAVGMYTLMYLLSFVFSASGAVLAICLRPPRQRWAPITNPQTVNAS
jgi:sugar phosphate permease